MKKTMSMVILLFVLMVAGSYAESYQSSDFILDYLVPLGGADTSSGGFAFDAAISQPAIGTSTDASFSLCLGVFCTDTLVPVYAINISGQLKYDNNMPIKNGIVDVTILGVVRSTRTDNDGMFNITNMPIAEVMMWSKNFPVYIHVIGDIEAVYQCTYNWDTQQCS